MPSFDACRSLVLATTGVIVVVLLFAAPAFAGSGTVWSIQSTAFPTMMHSSESSGTGTHVKTNDEYSLHIEDIGGTASSGEVIVTDKLPEGVTTTGTPISLVGISTSFVCSSGAGNTEVTCTGSTSIPAGVTQSYNNVVNPPVSVLEIAIPVRVAENVSGEGVNTATVSGGGAVRGATVSTKDPLNSSTPSAFGVSYFNVLVSDEVGTPFTQAGGHPYAVTVSSGFNVETEPGEMGAAPNNGGGNEGHKEGWIGSVGEDEPREIAVDLPVGLVGDPLAAPRCPLDLIVQPHGGGGSNITECPRDTEVGIAYLNIISKGPGTLGPYAVYNVVPEAGRPGEFVINAIGGDATPLYGTVVSTPLGNVVRVVTQVPRAQVHGFAITFFGNPISTFARPGEDEEQVPFLINPTDCEASEAQRTMKMYVDSWYHPGAQHPDGTPNFSDPNWLEASAVLPPVEGCDSPELEFNPSRFDLAPNGLLEGSHESAANSTTQADEPSAYEGRLKIPQLETFGTLSRPELKNATVTLPAGLSVSPSAANGLEGCSEVQLDPGSGEPGHCPDRSELGTVEVTTPLLEQPLLGHAYLTEPKCGGEGQPVCVESEAEEGKLFGIYMELDGEAVIKLPGRVEAGGYGSYSAAHGLAPGQLRAVFENNPQLPFGELVFKFKEGPRTALANPQTCGTYTTNSVLEPWSAPFSANAISQSPFSISWDGHGAGCPSSMPFAPSFTAGTISSVAGAHTPFVVEFSRQDREQDLSGITLHTPPGLLADLSGVLLCDEAQANAGTCGEASEIGTMSAVVGPGEDPFSITGGRVYLTESYKGQSFGLSIVVPADAGPFHLGNVVVRASIAVDPHTAALTITSNPLPQIVDGVPIRLRRVIVDVNRPGFMFNATNCTPKLVEGTLNGLEGFTGIHGSTVSVSSTYYPSGCTGLTFKPKFAASTAGKTSKAYGASLTATLSYPNTPQGSEANIAKVTVDLPKQLPSRLTTLQKACTSAQFESNPAGCPAASFIGHASVITPLLPVPLTGPAIFVSHGGEAFPSLEVVLQGYGVTVDLVGSTFISKAGITSTTFKTLPDTPFNKFELTLSEGPFSALTANLPAKVKYSLCGQKLTMPTEFMAQNGAIIHQSTPVSVTGCAKAKALTRAQKLKAALKACHKKKKSKRAGCERVARKKYGPVNKKKGKRR